MPARLLKERGGCGSGNMLRRIPRRSASCSGVGAANCPMNGISASRSLLAKVREKAQTIATRKASQDVIEGLAPALPELLGGSADLAGSNLTLWSGSRAVTRNSGGNYLHYGVREFGMAAIMNGIALHGGFIPYGGTFLTFSDYCRNALRMAALMRIRSIFVFTHDSIGLGEDGPTHQPIEHLACLRLIPNLDVWRPCDTEESVVAWAAALERQGRADLPGVQPAEPAVPEAALRRLPANIRRGGYVLVEPESEPHAVIIATGSEVSVAVEAQKLLTQAGYPGAGGFDARRRPCSIDRTATIATACCLRCFPRVAVEAGAPDLWHKYVGRTGAVVGIDRFGESAPAGELFKLFGLTPERVAKAVRALCRSRAVTRAQRRADGLHSAAKLVGSAQSMLVIRRYESHRLSVT